MGALLLSAVVAVIATMLICPIFLGTNHSGINQWMTITVTLAAWAVIVPSKLSEGRVEDQAPLRFTLLVLGAMVGMISWALANKLMLRLPTSGDFAIQPWETLTAGILQDQAATTLKESYKQGILQVPLQIYVGYFALCL